MRSKSQELVQAIVDFIDNYKDAYGSSPSTHEIADSLNISTSSVSRYLIYMKENGILNFEGHRNIITKRQVLKKDTTIEVPVLGKVACGLPKYAEENIEEYIRLPASLFGRGDYYILVANGNSMIGIGIGDGDYVLIRRQDYAEEGQVAVALIGEEATLKRYYPEPENHRVRLHPENSEMDDIYVESCIIQGVAVKVLKDVV